MTSAQPAKVLPPGLLRLWRVLAIAFGLVAAANLGLNLADAPRIVVPGVEGFLGYQPAPAHFGNRAAHRVVGFEAESPLPAAGVRVGDLIVDPPRENFIAGQSVRLQIVRGALVSNIVVRAVHIDELSAPAQNALDLFLTAFAFVLSTIIVIRRWSDVGALVLACIFYTGVSGMAPAPTIADHDLAAFFTFWGAGCSALAMPMVAYFGLVFQNGYSSRARPLLLRASVAACTATLLWTVTLAPYYAGHVWLAADNLIAPLRAGLQFLGVVLATLVFLDLWRHSEPEHRERLRWLFVAMALAVAIFSVLVLGQTGFLGSSLRARSIVSAVVDALALATNLVMAYAILRHRVVDVGFAINRAMVFAVFTGLLLVGFALTEWLVHHFVNFEQGEQNAWLDAAIAVALYLVFHRTRHWIERMVERVFFRSWHDKEARLLRFLETTAHFSTSEALLDATLAAVDEFSGTHGSGAYQRNDSGGFKLVRATLADLPATLSVDHAAIIEMKSFLKPVHLATRTDIHGAAVALPMTRRLELVGFLTLGVKVTREAFRPDEIDNLARTARQVGFDLYALRIDTLESSRQEIEQQNAVLRQQLQALQRSAGPAA